jgi:HD-like signal output (HDOD) protein
MAVAAPPRISDLLNAAERVGLFPSSAFDIFDVVKDPQASSRRIAAAIGRDPVLTARILKTANSPFYGRQRRVGTIDEALVVLGLHVVRDLTVSFALVGMSRTASPAAAALWRHLLGSGVLATALTRHVRNVDPAAALVLGILHDLGELVMLEVEPKRHAMVLARLGRDDPRVTTAERIIFGIDHAELGAACILQWGLPPAYAGIVREHHAAELGPGAPLAAVVQLADAGVSLLDGHVEVGLAAKELSEHAANQHVQIRADHLEQALKNVRTELAALVA